MARSDKRSRSERDAPSGLDLEALYARSAQGLLVYLARRTADPQIALDLWAETFAQAHAGRRKYRGSTDAEATGWLYAIARNQLAMFYRKGKIEQKALRRMHLERPPAGPEVLAEIERKADLADTRRELGAALARLTPAMREAVKLRVVEELDYRTVAKRLGISEPAARVRVSRGLALLADYLDGSPEEATA